MHVSENTLQSIFTKEFWTLHFTKDTSPSSNSVYNPLVPSSKPKWGNLDDIVHYNIESLLNINT